VTFWCIISMVGYSTHVIQLVPLFYCFALCILGVRGGDPKLSKGNLPCRRRNIVSSMQYIVIGGWELRCFTTAGHNPTQCVLPYTHLCLCSSGLMKDALLLALPHERMREWYGGTAPNMPCRRHRLSLSTEDFGSRIVRPVLQVN
jgi:hypothetical protein